METQKKKMIISKGRVQIHHVFRITRKRYGETGRRIFLLNLTYKKKVLYCETRCGRSGIRPRKEERERGSPAPSKIVVFPQVISF